MASFFNPAALTGLILIMPWLAMVGILALRRYPNAREAVSLMVAALLFGLVSLLAWQFEAGARPAFVLLDLLPGAPLAFHVEPLGLLFAFIVSGLWFITVLYAIGYMRAEGAEHQTSFYLFFAIAIAATLGAAFSANLLTLYLFYEALTLATYPLVTHGRQEKDRRGGRTYLTVLLGTSLLFLLLAIAWIYAGTGTLDFVPGGILASEGQLRQGFSAPQVALLYALVLFGTGKAALMPMHRWLPAAMVAPTPVSALLHAVAVVKLGVFTILKVTVYIFGIDTLTGLGAGQLMSYVAAATLLIAGTKACFEDNLKRRLAFSTISQLAYIVLAATLANRLSLLAGGMHIAVHAFAKITLFFCAGMILVSLHKTQVSELRGAGRAMPITFTAWLVASCCVIGLPLTGGFWSKWFLAQSAIEAGQPVMLAVILLGSLLAMGYLLPPVVRAFLLPVDQPVQRSTPEAPRSSLLALGVTALMTVVLFFIADAIFQLLEGFATA